MTFDREKAVRELTDVVRSWLDSTLDAHEEAIATSFAEELPAALARALNVDEDTRRHIDSCVDDYRAQLARSGGHTPADVQSELAAYREDLVRELV